MMRFSFMVLILVLSFGIQASDTPEKAVSSLFSALSHAAKEKPNIPMLKKLFHPEAKVYGVHFTKDVPSLMAISSTEFIKLLDKVPEKGFYECEVVRKVQTYDRFSQVYSVAETRFNREQKQPDFTGVNSIQLYKHDNEWQILSLYYQIESPSHPISLEGAKSGVCL
ncbi:hypothetical protein L1077_10805 [Pseudoalteromonas luteoviolacea]|uniref:hypothetical protein n=1 Tax=Pseudoalteromonas luteoviolacea TaxID=43657 RepID=UPI001F37C6D8|nr:hypothetical protein [Pseudoalteromonas luteoviolacea]MCF6439921.1 hypothetical protein [Pseudoalteromonas luteoviolacea]